MCTHSSLKWAQALSERLFVLPTDRLIDDSPEIGKLFLGRVLARDFNKLSNRQAAVKRA